MDKIELINSLVRQSIPFMVDSDGSVKLLESTTVKSAGKKVKKNSGKISAVIPSKTVGSLVGFNPSILPLPGLGEEGEISGKGVSGITSWADQGMTTRKFRNKSMTKSERESLEYVLYDYVANYLDDATAEKLETTYGICMKYSWAAGFVAIVDKKGNILDGYSPSGRSLCGWEKTAVKNKKEILRYRDQQNSTIFKTENTRVPTVEELRAYEAKKRAEKAEKNKYKDIIKGHVVIDGIVYMEEAVRTLENWQQYIVKKFPAMLDGLQVEINLVQTPGLEML